MGPETLALAGAGASSGGGILGAINARRTSDRQRRLLEESADLERANAHEEGDRIARERKRQRARTRAGIGASGRDPNSGSALAIEIDQILESELDVQSAIFGGNVRARGFEIQAVDARQRGRAGVISSLIGGVSGGLQAGSNAGIF